MYWYPWLDFHTTAPLIAANTPVSVSPIFKLETSTAATVDSFDDSREIVSQ
jgi:hypothetical protein